MVKVGDQGGWSGWVARMVRWSFSDFVGSPLWVVVAGI